MGGASVRRDTIPGVRDSLLTALVGEQLESVVFVMDYLQLDFGSARFSSYVWPTVAVGSVRTTFRDPCYRDALCAFIANDVVSVEESHEAGLEIRLEHGTIVVDPATTDLTGPEIAQ